MEGNSLTRDLNEPAYRMKAVHQIVRYLLQNGLLERQQLVDLAAQGFFPWDEVFSPDEAQGDSGGEVDRDETVAVEEDLLDREHHRASRRGAKRRYPTLSADDLCRQLAEQDDAWTPQLAGLTRLGQTLQGAPTWQSAAVIVRNTPDDQLPDRLADALRRQAPSLADLWIAVSVDDYRNVPGDSNYGGPALFAYRTMLSLNDHADMGSNTWLLARAEVAAVFNLRQAQRRLFRALGVVLERQPEVVAAGLRRSGPVDAYWSFALLYSARRESHPQYPDRIPPRNQPASANWPPIWGRAVAMDPIAVTPYLWQRNRLDADRKSQMSQVLTDVMGSLNPSDLRFVHGFFLWRYSVPSLMISYRVTEGEVIEALNRFMQKLRDAFAARPSLVVFLRPELSLALDAFIADAIPRRVENCYDDHFGTTLDLYCPLTWD